MVCAWRLLRASRIGAIKPGEDGGIGGLGVVAFWHGTEWAVSTERAGVGGAGE